MMVWKLLKNTKSFIKNRFDLMDITMPNGWFVSLTEILGDKDTKILL